MNTSEIKLGGTVIFWKLTRYLPHDALLAAFTANSFEKHAPNAQPSMAALKQALSEVWPTPGYMVRPLKNRDGFTIVAEQRGENENTYAKEVTVKLDEKTDSLDFQPWSNGEPTKVITAHRRHQGMVTSAALADALVTVLSSLSGLTTLRPSGGIYWLPNIWNERWSQLAKAVEQVGGNCEAVRIYAIHHRMDEDAARAVRDAIVQEVTEAAKVIGDDVLTGELGQTALRNRQEEAMALRARIQDYETILGEALGSLRATVEEAEQAALRATLLQAAG